MSPRIWVGLPEWEPARMSDLAARPVSGVTGLVLGDPFCPVRAFPGGVRDILPLAAHARELGWQVAYQTPVYLTERNFNETLDLISLLREQLSLDLLLVHDVGLLRRLAQEQQGLTLCWSLWGMGRADMLSRDFLDFLRELGVALIETNKPHRVVPLQQYGFQVAYGLTKNPVVTFGRHCYTEYVSGDLCTKVSGNVPLCRDRHLNIVNSSQLRLQTDGYQLINQEGSPMCTLADSADEYFIYARGEDEMEEALNGLRDATNV